MSKEIIEILREARQVAAKASQEDTLPAINLQLAIMTLLVVEMRNMSNLIDELTQEINNRPRY